MKRYIQHGFLTIAHFTAKVWEHPVHNHNHFELIFIHKGKGIHSLSGNRFAYDGPCLFLLAPCDYHSFEIDKETEFTFLKFTNVYLQGVGQAQLQQQWNQDMDQLLIHARQRHAPLLEANGKMDALVRLVVQEWKDTKSEHNETIFFLIQAMISMIRNNMQPVPTQIPSKHSATVTHLLNYLHTHIHSNEYTQLEHLAAHFNYSKNYLGIFFKEQTGMALRNYVNSYKLHVIENRLQYSSLSIKEISSELGFTDMSHFNKFFKNQKGMSPSAFREQQAKQTIPNKN